MIELAINAWKAVKAARQWWVLVVVLVAGAALYVWMEAAKADRAQLLADATSICAALGRPYQPAGSKQAQWGDDCLTEAMRLGGIEKALAEGNADVLAQAMERQIGKQNTDAALAAVMSQRTAAAVEQMEAANAAVEGDRVGPGWAAAVNELGGLRD